MLRMDRKRAFGRWFLLAVGATFLLLINGVSYMIFDPSGDAVLSLEFALSMGYAQPLMPLLSALAFGTSFCQDVQSGICPSVTTRCGCGKYLDSKGFYAALSGGLSMALGMALFMALTNLLFPPDLTQGRAMPSETALSQLLQAPGLANYAMYHGAMLWMQFMRGAFWALVALSFSAFYPNLPLTLCAPLVFYYAADALIQLPRIGLWIGQARAFSETIFEPALAEALLTALLYVALSVACGVLFRVRAQRRLRYA